MTKIYNPKNWCSFFTNPADPNQKRYEALRAFFIDKMTAEQISKKFDYTLYTVYSLIRDFKDEKIRNFFTPLKRGPKEAHKLSAAEERILTLRKKNYSVEEIQDKLKCEQQIDISTTSISNFLKNEGFAKLYRRPRAERLDVLQNNKEYPEISDCKCLGETKETITYFGGLYLFIPIIQEYEIDKLFDSIPFYGTEKIPRLSYLLSYLGLKLTGTERLSHINDLSFDYGIGPFAGLNVFPKATSMTQYSYRHPAEYTRRLIEGSLLKLESHGHIKGKLINLDFHSIAHFGGESQLEKNWIPTRGKGMKSILAFFAQDLETTYLCYTHGDIKRDEASDEVLNFVEYYQKELKKLPEYLIFDSKLTTYENLEKLDEMGIKFITLRKRGGNILKHIEKLAEWKSVKLDNARRKYRNLQVTEEELTDRGWRQIFVKGNGRDLPMILITNEKSLIVKELIQYYSYRWRLENNIEENVDFFNLNKLSSPIVVKVDFDIAITMIANSLYKIIASKLRNFEKAKPKTIFRNFIEAKAKIFITEKELIVRYEKKSYNPLIMKLVEQLKLKEIPWIKDKKLIFEFD